MAAVPAPKALGWALGDDDGSKCRRLSLASKVVEVRVLGILRPLGSLEGIPGDGGQGGGDEIREGNVITVGSPEPLICLHRSKEESNKSGTQEGLLGPAAREWEAGGDETSADEAP